MPITRLKALMIPGVLLAITGCAMSTESPTSGSANTGSQPANDSEDAVYTRTIVTIKPDGTSTAQTNTITRSEQLTEQARRAEWKQARASGTETIETVYRDSDCSHGTTVLFDQTSWGGNEICFYNNSNTPSYTDLATWVRSCSGIFCSYWFQGSSAVKSYDIWSDSSGWNFDTCFNSSSSSYITTCGQWYNAPNGTYSLNTGTALSPFRYLWISAQCSCIL